MLADLTAAENELRNIVVRAFPRSEIVHASVEASLDSENEPSLVARVVLKQRPLQAEMRKTSQVVDEFRTWLSRNGDDRFPYFEVLSEEDERELSQPTT